MRADREKQLALIADMSSKYELALFQYIAVFESYESLLRELFEDARDGKIDNIWLHDEYIDLDSRFKEVSKIHQLAFRSYRTLLFANRLEDELPSFSEPEETPPADVACWATIDRVLRKRMDAKVGLPKLVECLPSLQLRITLGLEGFRKADVALQNRFVELVKRAHR